MSKFGLTYILTVQTSSRVMALGQAQGGTFPVNQSTLDPTLTLSTRENNALIIKYPMTLTFSIERNTLASANSGRFRVYNLAPDTRQRIFHDRNETFNYKQIILQAGYDGDTKLPIVFQGNIMAAYSWREGVNWITEIEAFDGGFGTINGQSNLTVPSGYSVPALLRSLIQSIPNVAVGAIGTFQPEDNPRGITLSGNTWDIVNNLKGNADAFIDQEKAFVLGQNDYLKSSANAFLGAQPTGQTLEDGTVVTTPADNAFLISAASGLLGTPRRYNVRLDVDILFEPQIGVGNLAKLVSLEPVFNGLYKVSGIAHRGTISGALGSVTTTVNLWKGTALLTPVVGQ